MCFCGGFYEKRAFGCGFLLVILWWDRGESWLVDRHFLGLKICHGFWIYFLGFPFWESPLLCWALSSIFPARLFHSVFGYIGEARGVRSPRVDVYRSLSADGLDERLLGRRDLAVVDRDELELNLDSARVVVWRARGIADVHHLHAVRRDVGEPVFESIAHNHLRLRIVGTCAIERKTPDRFLAGPIGVDVDPLAVRRVVRAVVLVDIGGELLLRASVGGHAVNVILAAAVALRHEGKRLVIRRPAVKIAGRLGRHQLDIAAVGVCEKDLRAFMRGSRGGEGDLLPIGRDGLIVVALKVGGHS